MDRAERTLQVWQVLIGAARNRQTLTYEIVSEMIDLPARALGYPLYRIQHHCRQNGLPPLTVLVVRKSIGQPSDGYVPEQGEGADREAVFEFPWHRQRPRQTEDFSPAPEEG